jgi:septum formation protein
MSELALPRLVLASGSPRRIEVLRGLGLDPTVRPADVDESPLAGEAPDRYVRRLAREKAGADARPGELVLAADTTVVLEDRLLGKPEDQADARRMLADLSGRTHEVLTGVALVETARARAAEVVVTTRVRISLLTEREIAWYVTTGEPMDKAGAYGIQGLGALLVESIEGNYTNVIGLPLPAVVGLFRELGYELREFRDLASS